MVVVCAVVFLWRSGGVVAVDLTPLVQKKKDTIIAKHIHERWCSIQTTFQLGKTFALVVLD